MTVILKRNSRLYFFVILACLLSFSFSVGGCATLHKKFVRQKKKKDDKPEFVPVLDPIDYPPKRTSPEERYKYHYSLWQVWEKDLIQNIDRQESDKRQKYLLGEIIAQLQEMKRWVTPEKQQQLGGIIDNLNTVSQVYEKPPQMRSSASVKRKIQAEGKKVREKFNPKVAKDFLISE